MFGKILSSAFVKLSKMQWDQLEQILRDKNTEIEQLKAELAKTAYLRVEVRELRKYKENDELLFQTEEYNKKLVKENKELKDAIQNANEKLDNAIKGYKVSRSLESVYLQKIMKMKNNACVEYETVDIHKLSLTV
jgi:hypothetical protein